MIVYCRIQEGELYTYKYTYHEYVANLISNHCIITLPEQQIQPVHTITIPVYITRVFYWSYQVYYCPIILMKQRCIHVSIVVTYYDCMHP